MEKDAWNTISITKNIRKDKKLAEETSFFPKKREGRGWIPIKCHCAKRTTHLEFFTTQFCANYKDIFGKYAIM